MGDEIVFPFICLSLSALYLTLRNERLCSLSLHCSWICSLHPIHSSLVFRLINIRTLIRMGKGNEKTQSMHCNVLSLGKIQNFL